jgi:hypothetical protein
VKNRIDDNGRIIWDSTINDYVATALAIKYTETKNVRENQHLHSMGTASPELTDIVSEIDKSQELKKEGNPKLNPLEKLHQQ